MSDDLAIVFDTYMFITTEQGFAAGPYPPQEAAGMADTYEAACRDRGLPVDDVHIVSFSEVVRVGLAAHVMGIAETLSAGTFDAHKLFNTPNNDSPEA